MQNMHGQSLPTHPVRSTGQDLPTDRPASWIFAYGSLIWRPEPGTLTSLPGHVSGYTRRLYQGSPDHRGTPDAPGRVLTLLPEPDARCHGLACLLPDDLLDALDRREQGGYQRVCLPFHSDHPGAPSHVLTYIATPDNPHYLGYATISDIAAHIARAHGPSGPNADYVLHLARALRALHIHDDHIFAVEAALLALSSPA